MIKAPLAWTLALGACAPIPTALELELDDAELDRAPLVDASPSDDVELRERTPVRVHPLWPTPHDEHCPRVVFGRIGQTLDGGDMLARVRRRLEARAPSEWRYAPNQLVLLRDHFGVTGMRAVAAINHSSGCMMGWWQLHCIVTASQAYCPGEPQQELARIVRDLELAPGDLDAAGWFELVAVLVGAETLALYPDELDACTRVVGARAVAPRVDIGHTRVTIEMTTIGTLSGVNHHVEIDADGHVAYAAAPAWQQLPRPEP